MSGDEPLGDGHTNWHSAEESLTSNGMGLGANDKSFKYKFVLLNSTIWHR